MRCCSAPWEEPGHQWEGPVANSNVHMIPGSKIITVASRLHLKQLANPGGDEEGKREGEEGEEGGGRKGSGEEGAGRRRRKGEREGGKEEEVRGEG